MSTARFVVAQKKAIKLDVVATSIEVGTDLGCALVLSDEIGAPRHCAFAFAGARFVVRDLGSDTGTYRNGTRIAGDVQLAEGDDVIAGTTRLRIALQLDATPPTLKAQLEPEYLAFKAGGSGVFDSDPDLWARGEADLGKWPALRRANLWAARVLLLGLPLFLLWPWPREKLTDPGPLSRGHAALFSGASAARFPRETRLAQEQGCAACHATFAGTTDERCAQCHASLAKDHHPFASATADPTRVRRPLGGYSCAPCHQEHHGPKIAKPAPATTPQLCTGCHAGTAVEKGRYQTTRQPTKVDGFAKAYGRFRFAHRDHAAIECDHCHQKKDPAPASVREPEFAKVEFATCAGCHRQEEAATAAVTQPRPEPEHVWPIAWHGSKQDADQHCGPCHGKGSGAGGFGPELREVTRLDHDAAAYAATRARFAVAPRSHREFLTEPGRGCVPCHREGKREYGAPGSRVFWHELHLSVAPANAASSECKSCHGDLEKADGLVDAAKARYGCASEMACGACHREGKRDGAGTQALVPLAEPAAVLPTRKGNDFPHARHTKLECSACHEFTATKGDGPFAVPVTKPDAMRCMPCHDQHDHVGGGSCRQCHGTQDDRDPNDFLGQALPLDRTQTPREWPAASAFAHFSSGHKDAACSKCHRDEDVQDKRDLATLVPPTERDQACRDCHLGERKRFHWR